MLEASSSGNRLCCKAVLRQALAASEGGEQTPIWEESQASTKQYAELK